ncbi:MAG: cysteine desulfurase [Clostridia bacterium]|nr:cysteine desulfurase [Clostridia bacterium]
MYLDNSATTKPCDKAIENINNVLLNNWGNPSSLHTLGMYAENEMNDSRKVIASLIGAVPQEIFFTSGATEANNISILCSAKKLKKQGKRIVTSAIEHHSVLDTVKSLEAEGFEVVYIKPDSDGNISEEALSRAITPDTVLVSLMLVNNEVGSVLPVSKAKAIMKNVCPRAILHCDAVQAVGKMPINVNSLGVDLLTASAHKLHGPKGIGFLYKNKNLHLPPLTFGGGQEKDMRPGTESVPLISGFKGAVQSIGNINANLEYLNQLHAFAVEKLSELEFVSINSPENCCPYILNISVNGFRSETLLHFLESKNIFVSSGSACAKGKGSYVLAAMGKSADIIDSALRISFCKHNKEEDILLLCDALKEAVGRLKKR